MHRATTIEQRPLRTLVLAAVVGCLLGASALVSPLLPPLLALAGACVAVITALPLRPIVFLYALIVLIPFTAALPRGGLVPFLVPSEVVLLVTAGLAVLYVLTARRDNPIPGRLLVAATVLIVGTVLVPIVSYAFRGVTLDATELSNLVAPVQYLILFWIFANVPRADAERRAVVQLMILTGSVVAAIGLLQAAELDPVIAWLLEWYPTAQAEASQAAGRVTSVLGAWNVLGLFLVTILLLVAGSYPDEARPLYRINMRVATVLALVCLLATNLWSGMIGVLVGFAFIKLLDPRGLRSVVPLALVALVGIVFLLPEISQRFAQQARADSWVPETLIYRWGVWQELFLPRISERPLWGVSPSFGELAWPHPESQYIDYLYRSGAVSLLAHVTWLLLTATWLVRRLGGGGTVRRQRGLVLTSLSLVLVLSLIGVINPVFSYSGTMDYFWIILGLIVNGAGMEDRGAT